MKYILVIIAFMRSPVCCIGQATDPMNLNITIDNSLVTNVDMLKVIINRQNSSDTVSADYIPGRLTSKAFELTKESEEVKSIEINFAYNQYFQGKRKLYVYQIALPLAAIRRNYNIINIFNLDKPQNGKAFHPVNGQGYVFDYIYPGGGRLTKRI